MADAGKNKTLIDPIYQKYVRSVVRALECIILTVSNTYIDAGGYAHE